MHCVGQPSVRKSYGAGLSEQPDLPIAPCPVQPLHLFLLGQSKNQVTEVFSNQNDSLAKHQHNSDFLFPSGM